MDALIRAADLDPRRLRPVLRSWGVPVLLFAALGLAGCGMFTPERPVFGKISSGLTVRYVWPETTLAAMALAIADKATSNGQSVYIAAFADTSSDPRGFHAFFDPVTLQRFPNPELNWDAVQEATFYVRFSQLQPGAEYQMIWIRDDNSPLDDHLETTALLHRKYLVYATLPNSDTPINLAWGFADIEFLKVSADPHPPVWKIVRWQDREDPLADFSQGQESFGQRRQESRGH